MSTARKVAYNTIVQTGGRIVVSLLAIFTLRLSTNYLGATAYGYLVTVTAFITLFSTLTDWGLSTIAAREVAKDAQSASRIVGLNLAMRFALSLVSLPFIAGLGWILYHNANPDIRYGILLLAATYLIGSIQSSVSAVFVAKVRNDISTIIDISSKALSLASILVIVHYNLGYYSFIYSMLILAVLSAIAAMIFSLRYISYRPIIDFPQWKALLILSVPLGVVQIINMVYFKVDSILLSVLRTPAEVGYYGVAYKVIEVVMAVPSFFMLALLPNLAKADNDGLRSLTQKALDVMLVMAIPIFVGGLLLSQTIIRSISSAEFAPATSALVILLFGAATSFINAVFGNAIVAINHEKTLIRLSVIVLTLNIGLNLLLIPLMGINGAAIATSVAELFSMVYVIRLFRQVSGIRLSFGVTGRVIIAAMAMAAAWYGFRAFGVLMSPNIINLTILVIILSTVYAIVLIPIGGLPESITPARFRMSLARFKQ